MGMFDTLRIEGNILPTHPILEKYGIDPNTLEYQHKNASNPALDNQVLKKVGDEIQLWLDKPGGLNYKYSDQKNPLFLNDVTDDEFHFYDYIFMDNPNNDTICVFYLCNVKNGIVTNIRFCNEKDC